MSAFFIPCVPAGQSEWTQVTALDGRSYQITFRWSQRDGHWYLDLADATGSPIRSGMLLGAGARLLTGCLDTRRPPGELVVVDTAGTLDVDPGFADLGERFLVAYADAAELVS